MVLRRNARVNRPWTGGGRLAAVPAVSKANTSHDFIQHLHQQAGNRSVGQWLQRQSKAEASQAADHSTGECPAPVPTGLPAFLAADQGQPLPGGLRASAEQHFQHSLAGVRVHVGSEANQMARTMNARAFTFGQDVVFRAGEYVPETEPGQELLRHELGHVVAPGEPGARVLRALRYDMTNWDIPLPPQGHTAKSMHDEVDKKIAKVPPDIKSATVKGVTPGSEAEMFLWHILYQVGSRDRWDTFVRLNTAIGWPPPPGAGKGGGTVTPMGLVSVTIDDKGNATAELVQAGLKWWVSTGKLGADAIQQLQSDFQVQSVAKGDKDWGEKGFEDDVGDVLDSFTRLPASNKSALKGVNLLRFATLPRGHAGEFNAGGGVVKGAFTVTAQPTLKLADSAFASTQRVQGDFQHQTPASFQTILHEAGHAVEEQVKRPAEEALDAAIIQQNKASGKLDTAAKKARYDTAVAVVAKRRADVQKTQVSAATIKALTTAADTKKTAADAALKAAASTAKGFAAGEVSDSAAYRTAVDAAEAALVDYAKKSTGGDLDVLDDALVAAVAARDAERTKLTAASAGNPALAAFAAVETAQNEWEDALRTLAHTRGRSLRLDKFVTVVNTAKITPFTQYARDNWPYKPQEFYAEAYSLWLTDPEFVKTQYKPVFDFFDGGDYEK